VGGGGGGFGVGGCGVVGWSWGGGGGGGVGGGGVATATAKTNKGWHDQHPTSGKCGRVFRKGGVMSPCKTKSNERDRDATREKKRLGSFASLCHPRIALKQTGRRTGGDQRKTALRPGGKRTRVKYPRPTNSHGVEGRNGTVCLDITCGVQGGQEGTE